MWDEFITPVKQHKGELSSKARGMLAQSKVESAKRRRIALVKAPA